MKKLLYIFLTVLIVACSGEDSNNNNQDNNDGDNNGDNNDTNCEYVLNTLPVTNAIADSATFNGIISIDSNCEFPITEQGFVYATTIQPTIANNKVNVNGTEVTTTIENLEANTTYYVRTFLTNALGEFYGNEVSFISNNPVYLADNGITIKSYDWASIGDTGVINGITYTVVDEAMLREMIADEADVTKAVTTKVTDMNRLFYLGTDDAGDPIYSDFNQQIGSWDVSNVTDMSYMFFNTTSFNQPIGDWDVSSVTDMEYMFGNAPFNKDISSWDVSSVTNMVHMFYNSTFNQPIGNWDVSSVTNMRELFSSSNFNQPIGDWDVGNVTDMGSMFNGSTFNQDISSWDVSNVTDMYVMFANAPFNKDISSWDVSNVTDMGGMFGYAPFNKDISSWDVSNVTYMGYMFYNATSFNRDLSSWSVNNVTFCNQFSDGANSWTLPQPNFTNCTP